MIPQLVPLDGRIPAWDKTLFVERGCPFCQSEGADRYIRPDGLRIRSCPICRCYFVSPSPTEDLLAEFYAAYYAQHRAVELRQYRDDAVLVKEMTMVQPQTDPKMNCLTSLMDFRGKRVLDIGFGLGQNLLLMRKLGAEVTGIDLDPDSVHFVRNVLGIERVYHGDVGDLPSTERFDLITLHDVIEHPLEPLQLLRSAKRLLAEGGLLSLWTPNASSVDEERQPITFRVDLEHMQYLTFDTMRYLAVTLASWPCKASF